MSILIMILLISVLIIIHELGHFLAAKSIGINPERFGIGLPLGPTLFEKKFGDTTFCVHAFLLGGYVSFYEDNPDNNIPKDDPNRLDNKSLWQRAWVVSAGVLSNAVFALILVIFVAFASGGLPAGKYNISVESLYTASSVAAKQAGVLPGDRIIKIETIEISNPEVFMSILQENKEANSMVRKRAIAKNLLELQKKNPKIAKLKQESIIPKGQKVLLPLQIEEPVSTAQTLAKMNKGKFNPRIYYLSKKERDLRDDVYNKNTYISDGKTSVVELARAISDYKQPVSIVVLRNGKEVTLDKIAPNRMGVIGIKLYIEEVAEPTTSIKGGLVNSWNYLASNTIMMIKGLQSIFVGKVPIGELHGIIAIAKVGGDIIQYQGLWKGVLLTAIISMNLAIINFLPIPALDGGYIFFLLIEAITGKKVDQDAQEKIMKYGFLFLIVLMFFVIFNDIFALVTNKF